jgi:hypothetical protein
MEVFAGLSVGLLVLAALVVVMRTFALWRRTRGLPELLLGLYLSGATVLGYPLVVAMTQIPASKAWGLHVGAQAVMGLGFACLLLFTLRVFRPDTLWARVVVGLCLLTLATAGFVYFREVTGESPRPPSELLGVNMLTTGPIAVAYFWATFESLSYHRRLRLRLRLGLAEAVVVNRLLLWGVMTLAAGMAVVINLVAMLSGVFMSAPIVLVSSGLGIVHACCLFLAFHPPHWYRAWLSRQTPVEVA